MKKIVLIVFLLYNLTSISQSLIKLDLIHSSAVNDNLFIGEDKLGGQYFLNDNNLTKIFNDKYFNYQNNKFLEVDYIDLFNPLKVKIFYKNFNSIVLLDNKLSEISTINFNQINPNKSIIQIASGNENNIWVYNELNSKLELYNFLTKKFKILNVDIQGEVRRIKGNYKYCWVLSDNYFYKINYFGNVIYKIEVNDFKNFDFYNENLIFYNEKILSFFNDETKEFTEIKLNNLLIKHLFVSNQRLYIYNEKYLNKYKLLIN